MGGRRIAARLQQEGRARIPAPSTITAILHRQEAISAEKSAKRQAWGRFERPAPNELWQVDFKGAFRLNNGQWCYPLTALDDYSRYALLLEACRDQRRQTVQSHLLRAFRRYGRPREMLMDNGPPWGTLNIAMDHVSGQPTRGHQDSRQKCSQLVLKPPASTRGGYDLWF